MAGILLNFQTVVYPHSKSLIGLPKSVQKNFVILIFVPDIMSMAKESLVRWWHLSVAKTNSSEDVSLA